MWQQIPVSPEPSHQLLIRAFYTLLSIYPSPGDICGSAPSKSPSAILLERRALAAYYHRAVVGLLASRIFLELSPQRAGMFSSALGFVGEVFTATADGTAWCGHGSMF